MNFDLPHVPNQIRANTHTHADGAPLFYNLKTCFSTSTFCFLITRVTITPRMTAALEDTGLDVVRFIFLLPAHKFDRQSEEKTHLT